MTKPKKKRGRPPKAKPPTPSEVSAVINDAPDEKAPEPARRESFNVLYSETIPRARFREWLLLALHSEKAEGREMIGSIESNHVAFVMFEAKA